MNIKIENTDTEKTVLIIGLDSPKQEYELTGGYETIVPTPKSKRYILRPTESENFCIKEGQILGLEQL